jgi:chemotaxis signal transduction protein
MSVTAARINDRAAELREAFDRSFAQVASSEAGAVENLLAIRVGADPYALRLSELSGLFADKKITWLPSPVSELRGIAGLRGAVHSVYDLGMLLGAPRAVAPRWIVVPSAARIGLAFEGFDGYLSVRGAAIVPEARTETREWHVREILRTEVARPIVHLASILEAIGRRAGHDRQTR